MGRGFLVNREEFEQVFAHPQDEACARCGWTRGKHRMTRSGAQCPNGRYFRPTLTKEVIAKFLREGERKPMRQSGDELAWRDADNHHGRVIGYDEVRLEQSPNVPLDVVAAVEAGDPPKDGTVWASAVYLTAEEAVDMALFLLDQAARGRAEAAPDDAMPQGCVADDDHDRRWKLHVHACALSDHTFWVEKTENGWRATEVETGVSAAEGVTAREALHNYWERIY